MNFIKHLSWDHILGMKVEIRHCGQVIRTGTVEAAMPDSSIVWLASDGVQPRAMYESALEYEVWAVTESVGTPTPGAIRQIAYAF